MPLCTLLFLQCSSGTMLTALPNSENAVESGLKCNHGAPRPPVFNPHGSYQTFEQGPDEAKIFQEPSYYNAYEHRRPFVVWTVVLTIIVLSVVYIAATTNGFSISIGSDPVFSNPTDRTSTRSCTFAECQRTMCDPAISPFVCTAGERHCTDSFSNHVI